MDLGLLYRALAQRLPGALSVYGIEPHRLPRVPLAAGSITQMARDYVAEARGLQPQGPYRLGGLGAGAVIAPGITIGRGALIGAGAVVLHDVGVGEVAIGNPARMKKKRLDHV